MSSQDELMCRCPFCGGSGTRRLPPGLSAVFLVIQDKGEVTTRQLSEITGLKMGNVNDKVRNLVECGLIARRKAIRSIGGDEFFYSVATSPRAGG